MFIFVTIAPDRLRAAMQAAAALSIWSGAVVHWLNDGRLSGSRGLNPLRALTYQDIDQWVEASTQLTKHTAVYGILFNQTDGDDAVMLALHHGSGITRVDSFHQIP